MTVIINDNGFVQDDWTGGFADVCAANFAPETGLDLGSDADPYALADHLSELKMIRVAFPDFADGRGYTIARQLRLQGYTGRLRAHGHVLADQYAMARRSGFDEVEIDADLAARQPEDQWLARADWRAHDYQSRLRG